MKPEFAARLHRSMQGEFIPKTGVAGVTGVARVATTCAKSLRLQRLRRLRLENDKVPNDADRGVVAPVARSPGPSNALKA